MPHFDLPDNVTNFLLKLCYGYEAMLKRIGGKDRELADVAEVILILEAYYGIKK